MPPPKKLECFSPVSLFSLIKHMWVKPGACPRVESQKGSLLRQALALIASIRQSRKALQGQKLWLIWPRLQRQRHKNSFMGLTPGPCTWPGRCRRGRGSTWWRRNPDPSHPRTRGGPRAWNQGTYYQAVLTANIKRTMGWHSAKQYLF
jgi:hypothetical protein